MKEAEKMQTWEWLLMILFGIVCVIATAEAETLTENEAIQIALKNNLTLANSQMESSKAAERVAAARTHFYPSLQLARQQNPGDWTSCLAAARAMVAQLPHPQAKVCA